MRNAIFVKIEKMTHVNSNENINTKIINLDSFFKLAISVDCVIFCYRKDKKALEILSLECDMEPFKGLPSLVGDLVLENEDLDAAAQRIVRERASISNVFLQQVHTFGSIDRHPVGRVISVAYYAFIRCEDMKAKENNPHNPRWVSLNDLLNQPMAFDHSEILRYSLSHIRKNILNVPVENMLAPYFTLSELQSLYESILQKPLDKRNFRKKVFKLGIIKKTARTQKNVAHRPAQLYCLNKGRKTDIL